MLEQVSAEKVLFLDDVWLEPGAVHPEAPTTVPDRRVEAYLEVLGQEVE